MKSLEDQDDYEILEVAHGAGLEEIERAYQLTRAAYSDESLAIYSLYSDQDAKAIRERIDEAYRALTDPARSSEFEAETQKGEPPQRTEYASSTATTSEAFDEFAPDSPALSIEVEAAARIVAGAAEVPTAMDVFEDLDADVEEESQEIDGAALRRARLRRGIELDQIATVTKVGTNYLRCLEEEAFEDLPAAVYVRGFVTAYARAIGLDPTRVAGSYMPRVETARSGKRKTGLLGRN